jgi:hypothetical protein
MQRAAWHLSQASGNKALRKNGVVNVLAVVAAIRTLLLLHN